MDSYTNNFKDVSSNWQRQRYGLPKSRALHDKNQTGLTKLKSKTYQSFRCDMEMQCQQSVLETF